MSDNRKKKRIRALLVFICLVFLSAFGGLKLGEYMANKNQKPIENENPLNGAKSGGKSGKAYILPEDELVSISSLVNEFVTAEHKKRNSTLASIVDQDYYSTLLKGLNSVSSGDVLIQDMNFNSMGPDEVEVQVTYLKNSKKGSEIIELKKDSGLWKISKVQRNKN